MIQLIRNCCCFFLVTSVCSAGIVNFRPLTQFFTDQTATAGRTYQITIKNRWTAHQCLNAINTLHGVNETFAFDRNLFGTAQSKNDEMGVS